MNTMKYLQQLAIKGEQNLWHQLISPKLLLSLLVISTKASPIQMITDAARSQTNSAQTTFWFELSNTLWVLKKIPAPITEPITRYTTLQKDNFFFIKQTA